MSHSNRSRIACIALLLGALNAFGLSSDVVGAEAEARPAAELYPSNTVAFVRIKNGKQLGEKWSKSNVGRMLADPRLKPLANQLQGAVVKAAAELEKRTGKPLDELMHLFAGEVALGIVAQEGKKAHGLLLVDFGEQAGQASEVIKTVEAQIEEAGKTPEKIEIGGIEAKWFPNLGPNGRGLCYAFSGKRLMVASDAELFKQVFTDQAAPTESTSELTTSLSNYGDFAAIVREAKSFSGDDPDVFWFVDPIALVRSVMQNNPAAAIGLTFLPFTGLDGIRCLGGGSSWLDGEYESVQRLNVAFDSPKEGILKAMALDAVDMTPPNWVPSQIVTYMAGNVNPGLVFSGVCSTIDGIPGIGGPGSSGRFIQKAFDNLDVNFQEEILPLLNGRVYHAVYFVRPVTFQSGATIIGLGVKDADKAKELVKKACLKFPDIWEQVVRGGDVYYCVKATTPPENYTGPPMPRPCVAILGEELVFTDKIVCMEALIDARSDAALSLGSSLEFKLVRSRIETLAHGRKMVMGGFSRPEEGMRYWYEMAISKQNREFLDKQSEQNPFFKDVGQALAEYPLPPFEELQQYFAPAGVFATEDEVGLHYFEFGLTRATGDKTNP